MDYQWIHEAQSHQHTWLIKRNCALAPRQLAACFGFLSFLSLAIAGVFVAYGAWIVLVFSVIEVSALGLAFVMYGRHAADYDKVVLSASHVSVERGLGSKIEKFSLEPAWLRVEYSGKPSSNVELVSGRNRVVVGRFVPQARRFDLMRELRTAMPSVM